MLAGRAAMGYDHGHNTQKFYLGLALDPKYVAGFVEGCLERMGEDEPEDEALFRDLCGRTRAKGRRCFRYCRRSVWFYREGQGTTYLTKACSMEGRFEE